MATGFLVVMTCRTRSWRLVEQLLLKNCLGSGRIVCSGDGVNDGLIVPLVKRSVCLPIGLRALLALARRVLGVGVGSFIVLLDKGILLLMVLR